MRISVYSLMDVKARAFQNLILLQNDEMCVRAMQSPPQGDVAKWPSDFQMYHVGFFDDDNGVISPVSPRLIASFGDYHKG